MYKTSQYLSQGFGTVKFCPADTDLLDTNPPENALKLEM